MAKDIQRYIGLFAKSSDGASRQRFNPVCPRPSGDGGFHDFPLRIDWGVLTGIAAKVCPGGQALRLAATYDPVPTPCQLLISAPA